MHRKLRGLLIAGGATVAVLLGFATWLGAFKKVTFVEKEVGGEWFAYVSVKGPYWETGKVMADVETKLRDHGVTFTVGAGIYYDDPAKVEAAKLRSDIGGILPFSDQPSLDALKSDLQIKQLPRKNYLTSTFPLRNFFSYFLAPMVVYRALDSYCKEHNIVEEADVDGSVIEVYDVPAGEIRYRIELPPSPSSANSKKTEHTDDEL